MASTKSVSNVPLIGLLTFIALNLIGLDIYVVKFSLSPHTTVLSATTSCPQACVNLINTTKSTAANKESTISISAGGSTQQSVWTTVPGSETSFNKASYAGARKMYFQANISTDSPDRPASMRLFDSTHSIAVTGRNAYTYSTALTQVQSGEINPFSGDLKLVIQIKSLNGNLVTLSNPRIVILY